MGDVGSIRRRAGLWFWALSVTVAGSLLHGAVPAQAESSTSAVSVTAARKAGPTLLRWSHPKTVNSRASANRHLRGTSVSFREFAAREGRKLAKATDMTACPDPVPGLRIRAYHRRGYAFGSVSGDCSGGIGLWARPKGKWRLIDGGHEQTECSTLHRYRVPVSLFSAREQMACTNRAGRTVEYNPGKKNRVRAFNPDRFISSRAGANRYLRGTSKGFRKYIASVGARAVRPMSGCGSPRGGVAVEYHHARGFASGNVWSSCGGGYAAVWGKVRGSWRELTGTQEGWYCADLRKHRVPASVLGPIGTVRCYTPAGEEVGYNLR